jgi:hypothetical protein
MMRVGLAVPMNLERAWVMSRGGGGGEGRVYIYISCLNSETAVRGLQTLAVRCVALSIFFLNFMFRLLSQPY